MYKEYNSCNLCPRKCNVNRKNTKGICGEGITLRIGRAAPHLWEEPCISGENGSGTVFFSGCNLKCVYCQNYALSRGNKGVEITVEELADIFMDLEGKGVHNINLVTAEHFAPQIKPAVKMARKKGLKIPVILNSSGYVSVETLDYLADVIDIYLVDFKYMDNTLAKNLSSAENYPEVAKKALYKMVELKGKPRYDESSMMTSGVIVRHLCLPGQAEDTKNVIRYVYETYGSNIVMSIMSQYTPMPQCLNHPFLGRKLTETEYDEIIDFCIETGIEDAYVQDGESASESFIPEFFGK